MNACPDYASLLVDAADYAGRDDVAHLMGRFLGLAELKLNRALRVADMERETTLPLVDGKATLPGDFLEALEVRAADGRPLRVLPLTLARQPSGGTGRGYAVVGSTVIVRPAGEGEISLTYYGRLPPLSPANPVNWLLARAPDVYLYALATEIALWEKDQAKAAAFLQLLDLALSGLRVADERVRWANATIAIGGPTP